MNKILMNTKNALTIEYAVVMMALVAAFIALILTTASLTTNHSVEYRNYIERKAVLDKLGAEYIDYYVYGGSELDLQSIIDSDPNKDYNNFSFTESSSSLIIERGNERTTVELQITLGVRDLNGDGNLEYFVTSYVYGL